MTNASDFIEQNSDGSIRHGYIIHNMNEGIDAKYNCENICIDELQEKMINNINRMNDFATEKLKEASISCDQKTFDGILKKLDTTFVSCPVPDLSGMYIEPSKRKDEQTKRDIIIDIEVLKMQPTQQSPIKHWY